MSRMMSRSASPLTPSCAALAEIDGVEVVAVSNADYERARTWGETIGCASYPSAGELLDSEQIDFAFGFAPHHRMFELASLLVDREQAFAMEKPMSLDAGELDDLMDEDEYKGYVEGLG